MSAPLPGSAYELTIDGFADDYFRVLSFTGRETISDVYAFDVIVTANTPNVDEVERIALGQRATLVWNIDETPRAFYGIVASVKLGAPLSEDTAVQYHLRVVPRLWLLKRKRRSRVFQKMRVPDVVSAVLLEAGIAARWQLMREYPVREYCTQYEESDYRFITRLLSEAGIYFYFPQGPQVDEATLTAASVVGTVGSLAGNAVGSLAGSAAGAVASSVASAADPVIPGDTVIFGDDANFYPPIGSDDLAALAAMSAVALVPEVGAAIGGAVGGMNPMASAALGGVSAVAGAAIGGLTAKAAPTLQLLLQHGARISELYGVTRFVLRTGVRANQASFRDYDPERPLTRLESAALSSAPFPPSALEAAAAAATAAGSALLNVAPGVVGDVGAAVASNAGTVVGAVESVLGLNPPPNLEVYDHHSPFLFPQWTFANDQAPLMLRKARRRVSIAHGDSVCPTLGPARRFTLAGHPTQHLNCAYVVTSVIHRGQPVPIAGEEWRLYTNSFECAPANVTYVPRRQRRKSVQVSLTATVVGPAGEEIHVDALGQIKVQFHWDRGGHNDDKSSCWIRTMHPWGGTGWGVQFIPRIGMEVVVVFEGGDPDKPMVIGCLYNGTHPSPFLLPANKTRSGFRTQSSPGGKGFNELSFEDQAGKELLRLVAHRDKEEVVGHDCKSTVGADLKTEVSRNAAMHVGGNLDERVAASRNMIVGQEHQREIGKNEKITVHGNRVDTVKGYSIATIDDEYSLAVEGNLTTVVGNSEKPSAQDIFTWGNHTVGSQKTLRLRANDKLTIECGESAIELTAKGITIKGAKLDIAASKAVTMSGAGPSLSLGEEAELSAKKVRVFSSKATLELDDDAHLDGKKVLINCMRKEPPATNADGTPAKLKHLSLRLTDPKFQPYANKDFILSTMGSRFEGKTDGDGKVQMDVPEEAEAAEVTVWLEEKPTGPKRRYRIELAELPDASTVPGAQARLRNLGYYWGPKTETLDPATQQALREFQADHELEATGELDGATAAKLKELNGC